MASLNKVILVGNLTRDPELRHIPSGAAVCDLGLAVSDKYKNKEGELVESTCFTDVVAWDRQAEACQQYLTKGSPILVEGKLQFDRWENEEGQARSKLRIRANRIQFLYRGKNGDGQNGGENGEAESDEALPF